MKNKIKLIGIALTAIIGFTLASCGGGSDSDNNIEVTLYEITADGSETEHTIQLTFKFNKEIAGFSEDDITLSGVSGITKGTLSKSSSGSIYTLPIGGFSENGTLTIMVSKTGYKISGLPKTVRIYFNLVFTSISNFKIWLTAQPANTKNTPYKIKLNLPSISYLLNTLISALDKFLDLDLSLSSISDGLAFSGCTNLTGIILPSGITSIGASAFSGCNSLASITLPSGITRIGASAFSGCTSLVSVTFNCTITSDNFGSTPFLGDLCEKYLANSTGTYTTTAPVGGSSVWTRSTSGGGGTFGSSDIEGIAWGNNKFVAVGSGSPGKIAYSSDGIIWTAVTDSKFSSTSIQGIAWGNDKFVAGGSGSPGRMAYSPDGINWTAVGDSDFGTSFIWGIAWGNNKFVAVGSQGKMAYSSNGISWTAVANSTFTTNNIRGIVGAATSLSP